MIFTILTLTGFKCKKVVNPEKVTLNYWRMADDVSAFEKIIKDFRQLYPSITINYRQIVPEEYELELLNALAEDRGPDIVSIPSTWIKKYQSKISYMPPSVKLPLARLEGTIKEELVTEYVTVPTISLRKLKEDFLDIVNEDVVIKTEIVNAQIKQTTLEDKIYGLPLSVDTLVLYYNKDLLNRAGISVPPKTLDRDFPDAVERLTKLDKKGNILVHGTALGTSNNIKYATDILSLFMMQNGSQMTTDNAVSFNAAPDGAGRDFNPGRGALEFYANFAKPTNRLYTWNKDSQSEIDLFTRGKLAFMFGYFSDLDAIRINAPKLNFGVATMPQIAGNPEVNYATYSVEAVLKKSKRQNEAWGFVQFVASDKEVIKYLQKTKKPTVLKSLINGQLEDLDTGTWARQLLTAKTWYRGKNPEKMNFAFKEMIDTALREDIEEIQDVIDLAAQRVQNSY